MTYEPYHEAEVDKELKNLYTVKYPHQHIAFSLFLAFRQSLVLFCALHMLTALRRSTIVLRKRPHVPTLWGI